MGSLTDFVVISLIDSMFSKGENEKYSVTNIELQDKIFKNNYRRVWIELSKNEMILYDSAEYLLNTVNALFDRFNIPYTLSDENKHNIESMFLAEFEAAKYNDKIRKEKNELHEYIWYNLPYEKIPQYDKTSLLFGKRNSSIEYNNLKYFYNGYGYCLTFFYSNIITQLLYEIILKMTERDMYLLQLKFSYNREKTPEEKKRGKEKRKKYLRNKYGDYWGDHWYE